MGDEKKPDGGGGRDPKQTSQSDPGMPPQSADTTKTGMSSDTKLILGMVIAAIVATGLDSLNERQLYS